MNELRVRDSIIPCLMNVDGVQDKIDSLVMMAKLLEHKVRYSRSGYNKWGGCNEWISIVINREETVVLVVDFIVDEKGLYAISCQCDDTPFIFDNAEGMIEGIEKLISLL